MLLIDEPLLGPIALCCAPKTGCTSLTKIAELHGVKHATSDWHAVDTELIKNYHMVVVTVRDPRSRLLSLWRHWCNETKSEVNLRDFCSNRQRGEGPSSELFFNSSLTEWYNDLHVDLVCIRLESFHEIIQRLFGWRDRIHVNTTKHGPWVDYKDTLDEFPHLWREDMEAFGYA